MIKAGTENRKTKVEISGDFTDIRVEMLRIGESVSRIPSRKVRDELVFAFIVGALGDPSCIPTEPGFEELIHSDEES